MELRKITHLKSTGAPHRAEIRISEDELETILDYISTAQRAYDEDDPSGAVTPLEADLYNITTALRNAKKESSSR